MSAVTGQLESRPRDVREIIRDEQAMRGRILKVLESGPQTIPQIAEALGKPSREVVFWVMGLRKVRLDRRDQRGRRRRLLPVSGSTSRGVLMDTTTKKTIILFSGDFDKVMAAFIIANGAAAMGDDVTIFATFWGLNIFRKAEKVETNGKSRLQAMFGKMMPKGTGKLGLSKMNFAGMGAPMMKKVMKDAGAMSLEDLVDSAREQGVKFVACTLSMDILGFKEEEMIPGLEYAGVASYLGEADEANVNLFI